MPRPCEGRLSDVRTTTDEQQFVNSHGLPAWQSPELPLAEGRSGPRANPRGGAQAVSQVDDAVTQSFVRDEFERRTRRLGRSVPGCPPCRPGQERVDEQAHLVQQICLEQRSDQGAAAVDAYDPGAFTVAECLQHRVQVDLFVTGDQLPYDAPGGRGAVAAAVKSEHVRPVTRIAKLLPAADAPLPSTTAKSGPSAAGPGPWREASSSSCARIVSDPASVTSSRQVPASS